MKSAVFAVLMAALVTSSVGCCSITDTILYGRQCPQTCRPGWGECGSCDECGSCPYGGSCGGSCGDSCGSCSGCHGCPLFDVLGGLNPDRWLCLNEYCERSCCDTCGGGGGCSGGGCGKTYWGDWYAGDKAGCDSCDCHGNYAGPRRGRSHGGGESYYSGSMGGEIIEGERVHESGEPTPAGPMDNGDGNPKIKPGPRDDLKPNEARRTTKPRMKTVATRTTKAKRPVNLRTIDEEPQWTSRREE